MRLQYFYNRVLDKSNDKFERSVVIIALGDSVTMGCMRIGERDYESVYHARLKRLLERKYPLCVFSIINSGIDGDNSAGGLKRLKRDVISYNPDLVIIGFAINDACGGMDGLERYGRNMETLIHRIKKQCEANIILLTPNLMNTADNPNVELPHRKMNLHKLFAKFQRDGVLKAYANKIRQLAEKHDLCVADTYAAWEELAAAGVDTDALLINGLNHPSPELHAIPAELLMQCVDLGYKASAVKKLIRKYGNRL